VSLSAWSQACDSWEDFEVDLLRGYGFVVDFVVGRHQASLIEVSLRLHLGSLTLVDRHLRLVSCFEGNLDRKDL
jgi:hypothetical protein